MTNQFVHNEQEWKSADEAIEWIHSLLTLGIKPGLKRMEWMLERFNHPERRVHYIHVGGTNGKGSTVSFLRNVLQEAGFEVGSYTSPFIERFHNRIQLNGKDISDQDLLTLAKKVKPLADELAQTELGSPTEFEVVTMIAILYYGTVTYPDYVIWEVGLGGRLDSTNVVMPILSIITNVGYDHIHILGERIEEIAMEKAGIIKPGVPVVTCSKNQVVLEVLKEKAKEMKATFYQLEKAFSYEVEQIDEGQQSFTYESMFGRIEQLSIGMKGKHQLENASAAIMGLEILKKYYAVIWDEEHLRAGLLKTNWMGRLEKIADNPTTFIDGAHNPEGITALKNFIEETYPNKKITIIFSAMRDKEIVGMLSQFEGLVDQLILTQFDFPRAATASELIEQIQSSQQEWRMEFCAEENWELAYQELRRTASKDHVIIITGSLYFISEVRQRLKVERE
jgi:dihydrofolate synthase/folylpolyglutamate synthase